MRVSTRTPALRKVAASVVETNFTKADSPSPRTSSPSFMISGLIHPDPYGAKHEPNHGKYDRPLMRVVLDALAKEQQRK